MQRLRTTAFATTSPLWKRFNHEHGIHSSLPGNLAKCLSTTLTSLTDTRLMQIRYELTPDDVIPISTESHKGTDFYKVQVTIVSVLGFFFMISDMALLVAFVFLNDPSIRVPDIGPSLLIKGLIWMVVIFLIRVVMGRVAKRSVNKATESPGINGVFCEHAIEIEEAGFTESTDVNRGFSAWKGVDSVRETDNYVLITIRLGPVYVIPKRAFESVDEISSFVAEVNQRILDASVPSPPSWGEFASP